MSLEDLKAKINKNVKGTHCDIMDKSNIAEVNNWISTNHYDLNRVLSGSLFKGLPEKCYTLLIGSEACFKSSLISLMAGNSQKQGFKPILFDSEGAYTTDFLERWGVDCSNALYIYEPFVDNITSTLGQILESDDEKYFISIDSIGNLESSKLLNDSISGDIKADQGGMARKTKQMLKMLLAVVKKKKSVAVGAGHYYASPGMYATFDTVTGGRHMTIAPHIILSLKKSKLTEDSKKDSKIIGNRITAVTIKNRFYPAFQETTIDIDYKNGLNSYSGLDNMAIDAGYITKGGAWYTNTITDEKVQGAANIGKIINNELLNKLDEYAKETGYSSTNEEVEEKISELNEE